MDLEKQKALLSDFIYLDRERISSFYAQIFGGNLLTIERDKLVSSSIDSKISGGLPKIIEGTSGSVENTQESKKEKIDPHDVKSRDVIAKLLELAKTSDTPIRIYEGDLLFIDNYLIKLVTTTLSVFNRSLLPFISDIKEKHQVKQIKQIVKLIQEFFQAIRLLPAFILHENSGQKIIGTIKEEFLSEPIPSFYLKHGTSWLQNVLVIGIEENSINRPTELQKIPLYDSLKDILPLMSSLVFPPNSKKITPIAVFRRVGEIEI